MEKRNDPLIGKLFFKTYKVRKRLGEGSFGTIYTCYDIHTKGICCETSRYNNII